MPRPVLIDADPGVDDALALILALRSPEFSVKAVTTVAGNVEVGRCTRNALAVLEVLGLQTRIPVARGASKPLVRRLVTAPEVHGSEGLGNRASLLRHSADPARSSAAELILDISKRYRGTLTLVALGPLTNVATAIKMDPRTMRTVGRIVSMGGAFRVPGNTGPVAEFNYYVDPEAADIVLSSGLSLTIVPLDVTEQVVLMRSDLEYRARRRPNSVSRFLLGITRHYMQYHKKTEGFLGGFLHDPIAVGAAIDSSLIRTRKLVVRVETEGKWTRGMSVANFRGQPGTRGPAVDVAFGIDRERFLKMFHERLWA